MKLNKEIINEAIKYSFIIAAILFFISAVMAFIIGAMGIPNTDMFANIFAIVSIISIVFAMLGSVFIITRKFIK